MKGDGSKPSPGANTASVRVSDPGGQSGGGSGGGVGGKSTQLGGADASHSSPAAAAAGAAATVAAGATAEGEKREKGEGGEKKVEAVKEEAGGGEGEGAEGGKERRQTLAVFRITVSTLKGEIGKFQDVSAGKAWRAALRSFGAEVGRCL